MSVYRYIDVEELEVRNSLITLDTEVTSGDGDVKDIGFIGKYDDAGTIKYSGLFRDASDSGIYKIFYGLTVDPNVDTGSINTGGAGYTRASLDVHNLHAFNNVTVDNDLTVTNNFTVNGTVTAVNVNTLTVEDNIIVANSGPANVKEDAGFVIKRPVTAIVTDTPKFTGTASAGGTTTTVALATQTSRAADFYVGWVITLAGDVTLAGATVTASTSGVNPVLTFDTAASGATTTSTTYALFNKRYVGTIWDESTDYLTSYGFPREDLLGVIDPAGDAGDGNLAEYMNIRVNDLHVNGLIKTSVNIEDNIVVANAGPSGLSEDAGFVTQRSATRVVTADSPKHNDQVIDANYTSGDATIDVVNAATGTDYFKGWVIRYNADTANARTITASTEAAGVHTLTLSSSWSVGLTAGSDTVDLFNKRFVGTIYDESTDILMSVGFPREAAETVIDPLTPVNGNIPDYVDIAVKDINIYGNLNFVGGNVSKTLTLTTGATLTASQIYQNDIIYFNPASDQTWTLPTIASMAFLANRSKITMFVNINASNKATIQRNSTDTIEGLTQLVLSKLYSKTVLTGSSEHATYWTIKG